MQKVKETLLKSFQSKKNKQTKKNKQKKKTNIRSKRAAVQLYIKQRTSNAENVSIWWRHHVNDARTYYCHNTIQKDNIFLPGPYPNRMLSHQYNGIPIPGETVFKLGSSPGLCIHV